MTSTLAQAAPALSSEAIAVFCQRNHIRKLSLFGSILTPRFRPESDVDILVEFEPGRTPGLLDFVRLKLELSEMMGRDVDLRTPGDISRYFRDRVVSGAEVQNERV